MATPLGIGSTITNPLGAGPIAGLTGNLGFGGKGHHTQIQQGADPNSINEITLGKHGYIPSYDSNQQGSFEGAYNNILNSFTPDQLIKRYGTVTQDQLNTPLDQLNKQMYDSFNSTFGRAPTTSEWNQIAPAFQGPNGLLNGRAALSNLQQQYKSNPQLDPTSSFNNQKPGDISNNVNQQFQSILGRPPTTDELQHFSQAIQTGQIDSYGLGSFLKQQPEYTNAQDAKFRSGLNTELQNYDTQEFNQEKGDIISAYGANGMPAGFDANGKSLSPSLDYALTDLMGKISSNRSAYLANLSAQQYGGNKDLAIGNYQNTLSQMYNQNQQNTQNQRQYGQQLLNQGFAGADYNTQMNNYLQYMNSNKGSNYNPLYGAIGGTLGAIGGSFGGPGGAQVGYGIGSGLGNAYGYLKS